MTAVERLEREVVRLRRESSQRGAMLLAFLWAMDKLPADQEHALVELRKLYEQVEGAL